MGTWGVGLFSDDTTSDIRDEFRDLIGAGKTAAEATAQLFEESKSGFIDPWDEAIFWMALASTQWRLGRLEPAVRAKAFAVIDEGGDLDRWRDEPSLLKRRRQVLKKLRTQLLRDPPPPKRIPKRHLNATQWEVGEVVAYRLRSGNFALFRVIGYHEDKGGKYSVCELLDWMGEEIPSIEALANLPIRVEANRRAISQFMLSEPSPRQQGRQRLVRLGVRSQPAQKRGGFTVFPWQILDDQLRKIFGFA